MWIVLALVIAFFVAVVVVARRRGQSGVAEDRDGHVGVVQAISRQGQVP